MPPDPNYWLVFIASAPDAVADRPEIAAIMPGYVDRTSLSDGAKRVLGAAHAYHLEHLQEGVVFFAEITLWIEREKRLTWKELNVDFEEALADLDAKAPVLYLAVDGMIYSAAGDASIRGVAVSDAVTGAIARTDRKRAKAAVLRALDDALTSAR